MKYFAMRALHSELALGRMMKELRGGLWKSIERSQQTKYKYAAVQRKNMYMKNFFEILF